MYSWTAFLQYLKSPAMAHGALITIILTVISILIGVLTGAVLAAAAQFESRVIRTVYFLYVNIVRGTPLLVQLVFVYNALPQLGIRFSALQAALLALGINESAYCSEIIRGGITSVAHGQMEAARALGMPRWKAMRIVILPQAAKAAVPPLGNEFNGLLKSTSLVSVISVTELFRTSEEFQQASFRVLEVLTVATIYYLAMTAAWTVVQRFIERRLGAATATYAPRRQRLWRWRVPTLQARR